MANDANVWSKITEKIQLLENKKQKKRWLKYGIKCIKVSSIVGMRKKLLLNWFLQTHSTCPLEPSNTEFSCSYRIKLDFLMYLSECEINSFSYVIHIFLAMRKGIRTNGYPALSLNVHTNYSDGN